MQIEFTKNAVTLFGAVEKGDILNISEQSALAFIQAGIAKIPSKKSTAKTKMKTKPAAEPEAEKADV
ncbi:hypothetical protein [Turicimonas muris]